MIVTRINSAEKLILGDHMIECEAGEDLSFGDVVIKDTDNKAYIADIYNESHAHRTIGIVVGTVNYGNPVIVQTTRNLTNVSWNFEFKKPIFIGDYGKLIQHKEENGFLQHIGIPFSTNAIYIDIHPAILREFNPSNVVLTQDQYLVSRNQNVEFRCQNTGYDRIEWIVSGITSSVYERSLIGGTELSRISVSWSSVGKYGVKARIRNSITKIMSKWSNVYQAEVL